MLESDDVLCVLVTSWFHDGCNFFCCCSSPCVEALITVIIGLMGRAVACAIIFLYLLSVSMKDAPLVGMPHQSPAKDLYATYFYA